MKKLRLDNLARMVVLEARAAEEFASLSTPEKQAYALAASSIETAAPLVPSGAGRSKGATRRSNKSFAKKAFNSSVKKHFSTGRQLSSAHKKAISEGLKRWHAAHGNGNYNGHQRRHAINHINKHIQKKIDHHIDRHQFHKNAARRKKSTHGPVVHNQRAKAHLSMANHLKRALLPLPGKK